MRVNRLIRTKAKKIFIVLAGIIFISGICAAVCVLSGNISKNDEEVFASADKDTAVNCADTTVSEIDKSKWNLILVNRTNPLPDNYEVKLIKLSNGHAVDERCYPDLQNMLNACRAAGLTPVICSSYRTQEKQEQLFNNQVNKWIAQGYSEKDAEEEAGRLVAVPGASEHQLGLAVDIVDVSNQNLDESQEKTAVQKWLMENSWKYGFILRYPNNKSDITGIVYEPWHYRYVGKEAAKEIYESGICLEEYLKQ